MKEGKEHYVPLSQEALALAGGRKGKLFPGHERQMLDLLNKLRPGHTVRGFRSSLLIGRLITTIPKSYV
jgi:hypothetical protein